MWMAEQMSHDVSKDLTVLLYIFYINVTCVGQILDFIGFVKVSALKFTILNKLYSMTLYSKSVATIFYVIRPSCTPSKFLKVSFIPSLLIKLTIFH